MPPIAADADADKVKVATKAVTSVPFGTVIATVRAPALIVDAPVCPGTVKAVIALALD